MLQHTHDEGTTLNFSSVYNFPRRRRGRRSPRRASAISYRARGAAARARQRINLSFVLRSARDEALLEETLRFNLVARRARTSRWPRL